MTEWDNRKCTGREPLSTRRVSSAMSPGFALAGTKIGGRSRLIANFYFTKIFPCSVRFLLLKASTEAARDATSGDVVLLARPFSSFNQFRNHQNRAEVLYMAAQSIGRGMGRQHPYMNGKIKPARCQRASRVEQFTEFASGFSEEKPRGETNESNEQLN